MVELLIASAIGAVILAAAARILTGDIRSNSSQEAIQRLRDHWGRVNYFVDTEVREGLSVSLASGTGACASVASPYLAITVPNPAGGTGGIYYYNNNGNLWRCGPDIADDGSLTFNTVVNAMLVERATLEVSIVNATNMTYTLTMSSRSDGSGVSYSASSEARTTARNCDATSGICY
ncbi:hypothetical protein H8F26_12295 [Synechococcus sp. CBW1006]|nr:hypothetical protein H8F26_12295 [Synechococcus sp. CBW1006]